MLSSSARAFLCALSVTGLLWVLCHFCSGARRQAISLKPCKLQRTHRSRCIAVLARGDPSGNYRLLRKRQAALDALSWTDAWDQIIFHEGDIDAASCGLKATYIDVSKTFQKIKSVDRTPHTGICKEAPNAVFSTGYRAMCLFWFDDFLNYLDGYDEVLRVDDDCYLDPDQREPCLAEDDEFATSFVQGCDDARYTDGMVKLFRSLDGTKDFDHCSHPYTNVMWINLAWARATRPRKAPILATHCIALNRWGDLPLWGYFLTLVGSRISPLDLSYTHGSHDNRRVHPNVL
jgi:hypothetical protein